MNVSICLTQKYSRLIKLHVCMSFLWTKKLFCLFLTKTIHFSSQVSFFLVLQNWNNLISSRRKTFAYLSSSLGSRGAKTTNCNGESIEGSENKEGEARNWIAVGVRMLFLLIGRKFLLIIFYRCSFITINVIWEHFPKSLVILFYLL